MEQFEITKTLNGLAIKAMERQFLLQRIVNGKNESEEKEGGE